MRLDIECHVKTSKAHPEFRIKIDWPDEEGSVSRENAGDDLLRLFDHHENNKPNRGGYLKSSPCSAFDILNAGEFGLGDECHIRVSGDTASLVSHY